MTRRLHPLAAAIALAAALALSACGSDESAPDGTLLKGSALEQDIAGRLADANGGTSPTVSCPGNLPIKTGATMRCRTKTGGAEYGVTVTVTGVEDGNAKYDITVDPQPS